VGGDAVVAQRKAFFGWRRDAVAGPVALSIFCLILAGCSGESGSSRAPGPGSAAEADPPGRDAAAEPGEAAEASDPEHDPSISNTPPHSSRLALDWAGTYSGTVPCDDCPEKHVEITLHDDGRFERSIGPIDADTMPVADAGTFSWNEAGSIVTLNHDDGEPRRYQVGERRLFVLEPRFDGDLGDLPALHQHIADPAIENRRWRLIELDGRAVEAGDLQTEPFLALDGDESRAYGNASCNSFSGGYAIKAGRRIEFDDNFAMTKMSCPGMDVEQRFMEVLQIVDNYSIGEDGAMTLNRARMAPLARFVEDGEAGSEDDEA